MSAYVGYVAIMEHDIVNAPRYVFQAYHLTETFRLKKIEPMMGMDAISKSGTKLVYQEGEASFFFVYRFGSVVFFNIEPQRREEILDKVKSIVGELNIVVTSEEYGLEVSKDAKNTAQFSRAVIDRLTTDRIELLALVVAQSTALEHFECMVDELLPKSHQIAKLLQKAGRMTRRPHAIHKFIGHCMSTSQQLVASMYLLDKPDETWEDQVLDNLYRDANEMFELRDRYKTVDQKLRMIEGHLVIISNLLAHRKAAFLEWTIIILIAVEFVLFVFDIWGWLPEHANISFWENALMFKARWHACLGYRLPRLKRRLVACEFSGAAPGGLDYAVELATTRHASQPAFYWMLFTPKRNVA